MAGDDRRMIRPRTVPVAASAALAAVVACGLLPPVTVTSAEEWQLVTVDDTELANVGFHTSLDFNGMRYPHIVYCGEFPEAPTHRLLYAFKDDQGWHVETIDDTMSTCDCWASLRLEGVSDLAHLAYVGSNNVRYAHRAVSGWQTPEDVDFGTQLRNTSLALDHLGNPHVAYYDGLSGTVYYAVRTPAPPSWDVEPVASGLGLNGGYPSLGLNGDDPRITYVDSPSSSGTVRFAVKPVDEWQESTVHAASGLARGTSLRVTGTGSVIVAFRDGGAVKVAYEGGGPWPFDTADPDSIGAESLSLGLTAADFPYVAYYDDAVGGGNLMLAHQNVTWEQELVDAGSFYAGEYPSLQFTGNQSPHISYCRGCVTSSGRLILADAMPGDADNNGVYGSGDLVDYLRLLYIDGRIPPGATDCNLDLSVNTADYLCLLDKIFYQ